MSETETSLFAFENTFADELAGLYEPWAASRSPEPRLLVLNDRLAAELGLDVDRLATPDGIAVLVGNITPPTASPLAQAYSGHQFGGFSPRLGDGRALLVGELVGSTGERRDLHLKGSGRTPFARGGDGKAAVGPMLREYVIGEAMHALGIPTTRALAVVATGEQIRRETMLPGAVLARIAASHLRVGTFQYAVAHGEPGLVRRLADYAIVRHFPSAVTAENPYLALLQAVTASQASLIARWMLVGFVHGVMNTDNMTISGDTIDYGPCAFMERYDPATVFSSIDQGGRYAYGNQPGIAQWNLARLAETLLPLIDPDTDRAVTAATEVLQGFVELYHDAWFGGMRSKLGLAQARDRDGDLIDQLLAELHTQQVDFTSFFRGLPSALVDGPDRVRPLFATPAAFDRWAATWRSRVAYEGREHGAVTGAMNAVNPIYVPRNHLVEAALRSATLDDDLAPLHLLLSAVTRPFEERPGLAGFADPSPTDTGPYRTFCGT